MQEVVANNEAKYLEVFGTLHKVASGLRESRAGTAETRSKPKPYPKSEVPLELKVNSLRAPSLTYVLTSFHSGKCANIRLCYSGERTINRLFHPPHVRQLSRNSVKPEKGVPKEGQVNYDWTWKGQFDRFGTSMLHVASEKIFSGLDCTLPGLKAISR